ncbi:MAG: response regulator [Deltaproteobacteria bacterium]|nr:response regulator [Deltaproteobacteria bacterium]
MIDPKFPKVPIPDPEAFPVDEDEITVNLRRSQFPEMESDRPRVLLIDDDPAILRMGVRLLGHECMVDTARNAEQALALLSWKNYHVVITDHRLEGSDGLWLLEFIERRHPLTRRVIHTADSPDLLAKHVDSGLVQHFVAKPASRTELITPVNLFFEKDLQTRETPVP